MRLFSTVIVVVALSFLAPASAQSTRPAPAADRVLIISIDGLRPDVMLRANTPNIRALMDDGSFTLWARTTEASVTLPSHASMVTGVSPQKHKITWNADIPMEKLFHPLYPTIFERAKQAGYSTALVTGKSKFIALNKPGTIDYADLPAAKKNYPDDEVGRRAAAVIHDHKPRVMLAHFAGADTAGHSRGWGSPTQIAAIENIDKQVGLLVDAVKKAGVYDGTLIILSADHGGAGRTHGKEDPRSRHIPWIAVGPGIRKNHDLTMHRDLIVNTEDTFATACTFLGIDPGDVDGKPILQVLADYEMLQPSTKPTTEPTAIPGTTAPVAGVQSGSRAN